MKRVLLVGGGHSHLFVLKHLAERGHQDVECTLVSPDRWQYYSGMLPGWMAGHYQREEIRLDLQSLAASAGVKFLVDRVVGIDANRRSARLADGLELSYDLMSLAIGSETKRDGLEGSEGRLLTVKPLEKFQHRWRDLLVDAGRKPAFTLVVVGGGAAGVELALSARHALDKVSSDSRVRLVVGQSGLLRDHAASVRRRAIRALERAGVGMIAPRAAGADHDLLSGSCGTLTPECIIAATGASAPAFLSTSGLALDADGFVAVDAYHRSLSHPNVFAAGDVSSREDPRFQRSGVHAVRAGPILARNLLAAARGQALEPFHPRNRVLYLLACGEKYAIASWGRFSVEGRWVWRWKDMIDRGFVSRFSA